MHFDVQLKLNCENMPLDDSETFLYTDSDDEEDE